MPELPEVETIKRALDISLLNAKIESVLVFNRNFREKVPLDLEETIVSATITKIYRRAKYIILELNNGYSIIWHLGMSGRIELMDKLPQNFQKHDHIAIATNKCCFIFNDARRFGLFTYAKTNELSKHHFLSHLAIEPFDKEFTASYLLESLKKKKVPIKVSLLDQSLITGIGNIYASEALYEAKISPLRLSNTLTKKEAQNLVEAIIKVLNKAIEAGGSTLRDYKKPDGSMGYFQLQHSVYNKEGQRCPNCNCQFTKTGGIKRIVQCGRSSFYCEHHQK